MADENSGDGTSGEYKPVLGLEQKIMTLKNHDSSHDIIMPGLEVRYVGKVHSLHFDPPEPWQGKANDAHVLSIIGYAKITRYDVTRSKRKEKVNESLNISRFQQDIIEYNKSMEVYIFKSIF